MKKPSERHDSLGCILLRELRKVKEKLLAQWPGHWCKAHWYRYCKMRYVRVCYYFVYNSLYTFFYFILLSLFCFYAQQVEHALLDSSNVILDIVSQSRGSVILTTIAVTWVTSLTENVVSKKDFSFFLVSYLFIDKTQECFHSWWLDVNFCVCVKQHWKLVVITQIVVSNKQWRAVDSITHCEKRLLLK